MGHLFHLGSQANLPFLISHIVLLPSLGSFSVKARLWKQVPRGPFRFHSKVSTWEPLHITNTRVEESPFLNFQICLFILNSREHITRRSNNYNQLNFQKFLHQLPKNHIEIQSHQIQLFPCHRTCQSDVLSAASHIKSHGLFVFSVVPHERVDSESLQTAVQIGLLSGDLILSLTQSHQTWHL